MTKHSDGRIADQVPPATVFSDRHCHGTLNAITDSERRALRPIGYTAHEVAVLTGALLADLVTLPGVRIFQGVHPVAGPDMPPIPHVISAGLRLLLIESVAWPPGRYVATATGQIHCDGSYIGQSVGPLANAVRHWREILPPDHRVSGVIVVHPTAEGDLALPTTMVRDLVWTRAEQAARLIRTRLPRDGRPVSVRVVAALLAATGDLP